MSLPPHFEGSSSAGLPAQLATLKESITSLPIRRGARLFSPGETADRLFFLASGRVKISVAAGGGKQCVLRIVEPGEIFGECALFEDPVRQAEAEVIEKGSIDVIPRAAVMAHAEAHPEFWALFSRDLGRRVRELEEQVKWLTLLEVEQRIAKLLLHWGKSRNIDAADVEIRLSQRDIAGLIGATQETTSAALNRLRRKGCVDIRRRLLVVKSVSMLRAQATAPHDEGTETTRAERAFSKATS